MGGETLKYELSEKDIAAIVSAVQKALNGSGSPRVEIAIKHGEVAVYQINSKKVS